MGSEKKESSVSSLFKIHRIEFSFLEKLAEERSGEEEGCVYVVHSFLAKESRSFIPRLPLLKRIEKSRVSLRSPAPCPFSHIMIKSPMNFPIYEGHKKKKTMI